MPILLLLVIFLSGSSSCTSIESRAMGTPKPFPGIRYLNDPRHSMYGDRGALVTMEEKGAKEEQVGCFWIEVLEVSSRVPPGTLSEEACKALVFIGYWPFDVLDKHAQDKKKPTE
tara:strand:- start:93 stop:437 length:345 start_codon:yes stop_codon:yes gene_type:complete